MDILGAKINTVFNNLRQKGILREEHLSEALREVRLALLAADVHIQVTKDFLENVRTKALGQKVLGSNSPVQQLYAIVHAELVQLLGQESATLVLPGQPPHIILMVGLQGSGKTTTSAKLARFYKNKGRSPCLVPADFQRPAAILQLQTLAKQIDVSAFVPTQQKDVVASVRESIKFAEDKGHDILIVDTAGRLHVDENLMDELKRIKSKLSEATLFNRNVRPVTVLFVADAMTGQSAVQVAKKFHDTLHLDGLIMTKLDGDAKGGALLSIQSVTGAKPLFIGSGEKLDALEVFDPQKLVNRLLDQGDMLGLIEKAQTVFSEVESAQMMTKIKKQGFDLEDFLAQLKQMKKLGSMSSLLSFIPGARQMAKQIDVTQVEKEMQRKEAIVFSMTKKERRHPDILNGSRRQRIALGSGTTVAEINRFMKEFEEMKKMMTMFSSKNGLGQLMSKFKGRT